MDPQSVVRIVIALAIASSLFAQKRPLTHRDFDGWRTIGSPTLTRDGKTLAYSFMPQDGDGDLIVRDLASGKEWKEPVGALPPPPIQSPEEMNPEAPPPQRGIRILFTSDGKFVVAGTYPAKADTERARREKKKPEEMPKPGLMILNVTSGEAVRIADVKNFHVPEKGGSWLAYAKESKTAESSERRPGAAPGSRKEYGTELVIRDLSKVENAERVVADVLDYSFARDGKTVLYTVSSKKEEDNGVYALAPGSDSAPATLLSGKGKYGRPVWDREQRQAAFVSDRDDASSKPPLFRLYHWDRKSAAAREVLTKQTPGFRPEFVLSDKGQLAFSRDGGKLFVPASLPPKAEPPADATAAPATDKVVADLWHWKDDVVQPMQRIRANQERNRTYRGVWHIAENRFVQLADSTMSQAAPSDDGRFVLGLDDRPYRRMVDYDGGYADAYLVDTATGARKLAVKQQRSGFFAGGGFQWSPDGKYVLYYAARHWHLLASLDGTTRNVTAAIGLGFHDEEDDTPDPPGSYGSAGWTRDSQSVLLNDRYDVWQVFVDGRAPRNLTAGQGRTTKTEFRVIRLAPDDDEEERGIDTAQPIYLRAENEETRDSGFYTASFRGGTPQLGFSGPRSYRFVTKARDAGIAVVSASRFDEYPDLYLVTSGSRDVPKVTNGGVQKEPFLWGTSELIEFRNTDGVKLRAALYKPENFDPKKRYPLMVYIYERLSQNVHSFVNPAPGHSINVSLYVSNGYLVLTPDIVYTVGSPGQSALKCVLPAIQVVVDRGSVDENAIGIQGHSWGGYQIAYLITQTSRFRAAEAGAPVGNMTSAYSGIRWGSGMPRQFQYEQTQSRIGKSLYEAPLKFVENSPVFFADRVTTPLLILHDDQDDAVPWYQGIELYLALRRTGKEVYMFNYNGEFHGLRRRHNQKDYAFRMQQFFDHFLKGAPKPEWMEKGIPFIERDDEKERFRKASDR